MVITIYLFFKWRLVNVNSVKIKKCLFLKKIYFMLHVEIFMISIGNLQRYLVYIVTAITVSYIVINNSFMQNITAYYYWFFFLKSFDKILLHIFLITLKTNRSFVALLEIKIQKYSKIICNFSDIKLEKSICLVKFYLYTLQKR